jgi:AcrR family transcriptional regulator
MATGDGSPVQSKDDLGYGDARQAILEATGREIATKGPRGVVLSEICQRLELSPALVNYHFGGRDGLLAEAVLFEHRRLVQAMNDLTLSITTSGEDQFRERFKYRFDWTRANPGFDSMLNHTHLIDPSGDVMNTRLQTEIGAVTTLDMQGITTSIAGMYHGTVLNELITDSHPLWHPEFADITAFVGLAAIGAATFVTGNHPGSTPLAMQFPAILASLQESFVDRLVDSIRCQFDRIT